MGQEDGGPEVREEGFAGEARRVDEDLEQVARGEKGVVFHGVGHGEVELRAGGEVGGGGGSAAGGGVGRRRVVVMEGGDEGEEADGAAERADLGVPWGRGGVGTREVLDAVDGELQVGQRGGVW